VKGILALGRFLLWLLFFLFCYSSFMILIQYGTGDYASKMITSWSSIGQEFEKSYETLQSGGPATGEGAQPGAVAGAEGDKTAPPPGFVPLLIWGSVILFLLGFFWLVAVAFQESLLWGLATLFVIGAIPFWISHFRESTPPFLLVIIASVVFGFTIVNYGIDPYQYFLGPPPKPKSEPTEPSPLDDIVPPAAPGAAPKSMFFLPRSADMLPVWV
jgi:hypothetical protein